MILSVDYHTVGARKNWEEKNEEVRKFLLKLFKLVNI